MTKLELRTELRKQMKKNQLYIALAVFIGIGAGYLFAASPLMAIPFIIGAVYVGVSLTRHTYACGLLSGANGGEKEVYKDIRGLL